MKPHGPYGMFPITHFYSHYDFPWNLLSSKFRERDFREREGSHQLNSPRVIANPIPQTKLQLKSKTRWHFFQIPLPFDKIETFQEVILHYFKTTTKPKLKHEFEQTNLKQSLSASNKFRENLKNKQTNIKRMHYENSFVKTYKAYNNLFLKGSMITDHSIIAGQDCFRIELLLDKASKPAELSYACVFII